MTSGEQRFRVSVNVQVQQLRAPYPDAPPEQWQPLSYPGLEVREGYDVTAGGFMVRWRGSSDASTSSPRSCRRKGRPMSGSELYVR